MANSGRHLDEAQSSFPVRHLYHFCGISGKFSLMSELGTREQILESFRSGSALASWLDLCPDNRICSTPTYGVPPCGAALWGLAVCAVLRLRRPHPQSQNPRCDQPIGPCHEAGCLWAAEERQPHGRLLPAHESPPRQDRGAGRHRPRTHPHPLWHNPKSKAYDEIEAFRITPQNLARRRRNLEKQAPALGLQLVEAA